MQRPSIRATAIVALGALVIACGGRTPTPAPTVPQALPGTQWILGIQGGTAPDATNNPTVVFGTDGSISGFSGCTTFGGTFTATGSALVIANVAKTPTQNPCAPQTLAREDAYLDALAKSTTWQAGDLGSAVPTGLLVLAPVKLLLTGGPTQLIFTQD